MLKNNIHLVVIRDYCLLAANNNNYYYLLLHDDKLSWENLTVSFSSHTAVSFIFFPYSFEFINWLCLNTNNILQKIRKSSIEQS